MTKNDTLSNGLVAWRKEWILPFESPWGILEKFRFANQIDGNEVLSLLGNEKIKKIKTLPLSGKKHRNIIRLTSFDELKTQEILGINLVKYNKQLIHDMFTILPEAIHTPEIYFKDKLTYCSKCMKDAYHSIFHQVRLFNKCPFHDLPLFNKCIKCNKQIDYLLSNSPTDIPFQCNCKQKLFEPNNIFFERWILRNYILNDSTEKWLQLNQEQHNNKYFIYYPFLDKKNYYSQHCNNESVLTKTFLKILNNFKQSTDSPNLQYISSTDSIFRIKNNQIQLKTLHDNVFRYRLNKTKDNKVLTNKEIEEAIRYEVYLSTKQTFKSIARFIRHHILKDHTKCVKLFHKSRMNEVFCVHSLAYIKWRKEVEAITDIWRVESGLYQNTGIEFDNKPENYSIYYGGLFRKQFHELINNTYKPFLLNFKKCNLASIKWFINHLISYVIVDSFARHLHNALNSLQPGEISRNNNYFNTHQSFPLYVALIPKSLDKKIQFYYQKDCCKKIKHLSTFIEKKAPCTILKNKIQYNEYENPMQQAINKLNERYHMI
ncbi:hypothetical protein ACQKFU_29880 [Bacillus mycoides]|uniref:hypothetical protein n=1 Tax=Bacillus mycoides TaxID=1405 RepID=UPI003CFE7AB4